MSANIHIKIIAEKKHTRILTIFIEARAAKYNFIHKFKCALAPYRLGLHLAYANFWARTFYVAIGKMFKLKCCHYFRPFLVDNSKSSKN